MAEILFNPMSEETEEKFKQAIEAAADCMGVEIAYETLSVVRVSWKGSGQMEEVVRLLAGNNISQVKKAGNRYSKPVSAGQEDPKNP